MASEQASVERVMAGVQADLAKVDATVHGLEKQLYDAHYNLVRFLKNVGHLLAFSLNLCCAFNDYKKIAFKKFVLLIECKAKF